MAFVVVGGAGLAVAALGAAAVAGAVGLGLAGAALFARRGRRPPPRPRHHHTGYGRRHRRDIQSQKEQEHLSNLFEVIKRDDATGCGLRLVCELSAKDETSLSEEEQNIIDLVGPPVQPGEQLEVSQAWLEYKDAAGVGQNGGDCSITYFTCPANAPTIMQNVVNYLP